jgi:Fic family protein
MTKQLKSDYKNPERMEHWVLSDRIGKRDPGNKPKSGDRIKFLHFVNPLAKLNGERIETPEFIKENNGKIDPLILAGIFHKQMVIIHPFTDGNGRTTRLATARHRR